MPFTRSIRVLCRWFDSYAFLILINIPYLFSIIAPYRLTTILVDARFAAACVDILPGFVNLPGSLRFSTSGGVLGSKNRRSGHGLYITRVQEREAMCHAKGSRGGAVAVVTSRGL